MAEAGSAEDCAPGLGPRNRVAENRHGPADADGKPGVAGARFVVRLPAP